MTGLRYIFLIILIPFCLTGVSLQAQDPALEKLRLLEIARPDSIDVVTEESEWTYIADSVAIGDMDTSYFNSGDPESNLLRSAEFGQMEVVKMLVERGVNVDAESSEGVTPLMYASQNGDVEIMKYLLSRNADVNRTPYNDVTALIGAARTGQYEAVVLLLDSGARVDAKDELSLTALMHAAAYNYPDVVEALLRHGADPELGDWYGSRSLMMAAYYNSVESADVLLAYGADPDGKDKWGFTPLMVCARHGDYDMAWLLLDKGADPSLKNNGGMHALAMAVNREDTDMAELLLESGARINQKINSSTNALSLAREEKDSSMISFLVRNGARLNRNPEIYEIRGSFNLNFNGNDFMMGMDAGIAENKYKLYLTSGFLVRPSRVSVLRPENDTLAFQMWERRFVWPFSLGRDFLIHQSGTASFLCRIHLSGALTWGNYRGSSLTPDPRYMLVPGAGISWRDRYVGISFDYQYLPIRVSSISNHRFSMSIIGYFDFRQRVRYTRKDISWF